MKGGFYGKEQRQGQWGNRARNNRASINNIYYSVPL